MQPHAHRADESLLPRHRAGLGDRHQPVPREFGPCPPETGGATDPQNRLQVAQSSRTFLDVGLQVVDRVVDFEVPLLLLERLGRVESVDVQVVREHGPELPAQAPRAVEKAIFEEAGPDGDVAGHFRHALGDGADGVAQLHAGVPQRGEEPFDGRGGGGTTVGQKDQHVDVGMREELTSAVAADGQQREFSRHVRLAPHAAHDAIDKTRMFAQQLRRIGMREEREAQRLATALQLVAPERDAGSRLRKPGAGVRDVGNERRRGRHRC